MTNKNFSMVDGKRIGIAPNLTLRLHRVDSVSILSRQSLLPILLLCLTLFVGVGNAWGTATYTKITSTSGLPDDGSSAKYLIVYEALNYVYDGSKTGTNLGASNDYKSAGNTTFTRSGSTITINGTDNFYFTISRSGNNYIIQSASGYYIGRTDNSNGLNQSTSTSYNHTITFSSNNAQIVSSAGPKLQFLNSSGSYTFKYYKSSQQLVQLYKEDASTPSITTSTTSMTGVGYSTDDFSQQVKSFTVSGSNLTAYVTIDAPTNYEVCKTSGGTYTSSISFTPTSGTLATSTVYVRLQSGKTASNYSGNVACSSSGATTKNVAVSGSVPFTVTWKANGTTHATTYVAYATGSGTALGSLPDDPDPDDYSCSGTNRAFYGWFDGTSYKNANTAPTIISSNTQITSDKTFKAVFADASGGGSTTTWVKTEISAAEAGTYALITPDGHAFNGTINGSGHGSVTANAFSFTNNVATSAPTGTCEIEFQAVTGGFKLYNSSNGYLYASAASSGNLNWHNTENSYWKYASSNWLYNSNSAYLRTYQNASFRTYDKANNSAFSLAKKTTVSTTTYSNYATSCCTPLGSIKGSVSVSQTSATLTWEAVTGAEKYEYQIQPKGTASADNAWVEATSGVVASNLSCGTEYTAYFRAIDTNSSHCSVGPESSKDFETSSYSIALLNNGSVLSGDDIIGLFETNKTTACSKVGTPDVVTLTAEAETGYHFESWDVYKTGESSTKVTVTNNQFTMPAYDVTVSAVFAANTSPSLTVLDSQAEDVTAVAFGNQEINTTSGAQTFTLYGENLTADVTWALSGSDASYFAVTPASPIDKATAESNNGREMSITFTPNAARNFSATLTFSSTGASNKVITLSGTGKGLCAITFIDNGEETVENWLDGSEQATPAITACNEDYSVVGWTTTAPTNNAWASEPAIVDNITVAGEATYYAVYATEGAATNNYKKITNASELISGRKYVITNTEDTKALDCTEFYEDQSMDVTGVTPSAGIISTTKANNIFTISGNNTDGYSISNELYGLGYNSNEAEMTRDASVAPQDWQISVSEGNVNIQAKAATNKYLHCEYDNEYSEYYYFLNTNATANHLYRQMYEMAYTANPDCREPHTITLTNGGTGVNGTFSAAVSTAKVGDEVVVTATPAAHYHLEAWTVTESTVTEDQGVYSFIMPDEDVTINATFAENASRTVIFKNNNVALFNDGGNAATFDATNNWKQKVYVGEAPVMPTALTQSNACDNNSNAFYGWTQTAWDGKVETQAEIDALTDAAKVYATDFTGATVAEGAGEIVYHAVWAESSSVDVEVTKTYGFEDNDDASLWTINGPTASTTRKKSGSYSGYINQNNTYVTFKEQVKVTAFSCEFLRKSNNNNYNVYIEKSENGTEWTAVETYAMSSFTVDTWTSISHSFDGNAALYVRFHCSNTTADRFVDDLSITYNGTNTTYSNFKTTCCPTNDVTVTLAAEPHGNVTASPEAACDGEEVTLTITPDEGYELATLLVAGVDKKADVVENEYAFNIGSTDVVVSATFSKIAVTSVTINGNANVQKDAQLQLSLTILPTTARPTIVWSTSDENKATVNQTGLVTGVAQGEVTITATVDGVAYNKVINVTRTTKLGSIEVSGTPKTAYTLNEEFVAPSVQANYLYADDDQLAYVETITEGVTFTGFDNQNAGQQTVTVSYNEKEDNYNVTVAPWTLHLQTKRMYGNDVETPSIADVTVNSLETPTALSNIEGLCEGYTQVGYISSADNVTAQPAEILTSYTPTANNQTLYGVFKKTVSEGEEFVNEDFSSVDGSGDVSYDWLASASKAVYNSTNVKFGSNSYAASMTTEAFDMSNGLVVKVKAQQYSGSEKTIYITVGSDQRSITNLTSSMVEYTFNFGAEDATRAVEISTNTDSKRAYIGSIHIYTETVEAYTSVYDCREPKDVEYVIGNDKVVWTACANTTVMEGQEYTLCAEEPSLQGYDFGGWIINGDEENVKAAGTSVEVAEDLTITPKFTEHVYDYSYALAATATNGTIASVTVNGVAKDLAEVALHDGDAVVVTAVPNTNYEISEWTKSENITSLTTDGNTASFTVAVSAGDMTIAAVFVEKAQYTMTLNVFGRTYTTKQGHEGDTYSSVLAGAASPALTGYTFQGWSTDAENANAIISGEELLTADVTLYAIVGSLQPTGYVYHKVTSMEDVTADGYYLIVNEAANKAFDGSRNSSSDLDKSNNYVTVSVSENQIISNAAIDAAVVTIGTIPENDSLYIKTASGYYIGNNGSNGLNAHPSTVYRNALSFSEGNFVVNSGAKQDNKDMVLMFNDNAGNGRFGYYKGTQKPIQLYKRGEVHSEIIPEAEPVIEISTEVSASTSFPGGYVGDVTVVNGGSLNADINLSVGDLIIHSTLGKGTGTSTSGNAPGSCGQIANGSNITVNGDVYLELELTQDAAASAGWYAFSVPFPVDAMNGVYYGNTKLQNEVGYAIMSYHGDIRAQGQYAWKKYRDIMEPGVLYIIAVGDTDYKTLRFKKHGTDAFNATPNVSVKSYPVVGDVPATNRGWNGIGNPNMQISYLPQTTNVAYMQFLIHEENRFQVRTRSNVNVVVGSAFFVQYSGNSDATIEITPGLQDGANGYLAPKRERNAIEETIYEVELTNVATEEVEDNIFLTAREEALNEYEVGRDLAKMSMGNAKCAQMWVPAYGTQLCAADFQLINDKAEYPLIINTPKAGTYSINAQENENATIYLTRNGRAIWNLSMSACELDLAQGQNEGYGLRLVVNAPAVVTGVDQIDAKAGAQKVIIDEHVYILRGGQMYDVNGKLVK